MSQILGVDSELRLFSYRIEYIAESHYVYRCRVIDYVVSVFVTVTSL